MNLDIRDISIINELPVLYKRNDILTVGCGEGRIERGLVEIGMDVLATDIDEEKDIGVPYRYLDILDKETHPEARGTVICAQVLEHIKEWKVALKNLINLATERVIVSIPVARSFYSEDHINFWINAAAAPQDGFESVAKFEEVALPYSLGLRIIITKPEDRARQYNYLITIDKNQKIINEVK